MKEYNIDDICNEIVNYFGCAYWITFKQIDEYIDGYYSDMKEDARKNVRTSIMNFNFSSARTFDEFNKNIK